VFGAVDSWTKHGGGKKSGVLPGEIAISVLRGRFDVYARWSHDRAEGRPEGSKNKVCESRRKGARRMPKRQKCADFFRAPVPTNGAFRVGGRVCGARKTNRPHMAAGRNRSLARTTQWSSPSISSA
jgi:hypothetical protein